MGYSTIFYICGGLLAAGAVITSFIGLRSEKFPGRFAPLLILAFVALIGATATYAILNGQEEQEARAQELEGAGQQFEEEEANPEAGSETKAPAPAAKPAGPGGTVQLAASPTAIAYDTTKLTSKPGKVTIEFTNPAALEHDVAIEKDGKEIAVSETIGEGKTSVSAELASGTYTFLCTVPGHAEAGMEGTLTLE
jgi:plastocyanin